MPRSSSATNRKLGGATKLVFHPLTSERWTDFEQLFGDRGACGGCWCMWWRLARGEFNRNKGAKNRATMKRLVTTGRPPGILAFHGDLPVGWCAVAPRIDYPVLKRSRVLKPIDEEPVWSVTCFFVAKPYRRLGITVQLLRATLAFVRNNGGRIVEGYPIEPKTDDVPGAFVWTGLVSAFRRAGFVEMTRRSATRPIMRYIVANDRAV